MHMFGSFTAYGVLRILKEKYTWNSPNSKLPQPVVLHLTLSKSHTLSPKALNFKP